MLRAVMRKGKQAQLYNIIFDTLHWCKSLLTWLIIRIPGSSHVYRHICACMSVYQTCSEGML